MYVLNHTTLLKPLLPCQRNKDQWEQAFKETAGAGGRGGNFCMSAVQGCGEEKQGN